MSKIKDKKGYVVVRGKEFGVKFKMVMEGVALVKAPTNFDAHYVFSKALLGARVVDNADTTVHCLVTTSIPSFEVTKVR